MRGAAASDEGTVLWGVVWFAGGVFAAGVASALRQYILVERRDFRDAVDILGGQSGRGSQVSLLRLRNGLSAAVISDPGAQHKAAASVTVRCGHQQDPTDLPGVAHLTEHMFFLGSQKHPEENAFKSFISRHGGKCNASTSGWQTTFYFDVNNEKFCAALDIFAHCLIQPLFRDHSTEKEMRIVDAEHSKNVQNDTRRLIQVLKAACHSDTPGLVHPYSKFGTGNTSTLSSKGMDVLIHAVRAHF